MALPTASDNQFPKIILEEVANDGSATVTPAADHRALFLGEDGGLHLKDSAAAVTDIVGASAHIADSSDAHDASAISVLDTATNFSGTDVEAVLAELQDNIDAVGGSSFVGSQTVWAPVIPGSTITADENTADRAYIYPVALAGSMRLRSLMVNVSSSAAGSIQWGLFDASSDPTSCTKLAGGSAAPGGTGWRAIAATGAPVTIAAGQYWLIVKQPAATVSTLRRYSSLEASHAAAGVQASYTWDDTPTIVSGWTVGSTIAALVQLRGDIDGSNQW